jgi:hypothetical protein
MEGFGGGAQSRSVMPGVGVRPAITRLAPSLPALLLRIGMKNVTGRAHPDTMHRGLPRQVAAARSHSPLRIDVLAQTLHETSRARFNAVGVS